jgi:hypothetical protein
MKSKLRGETEYLTISLRLKSEILCVIDRFAKMLDFSRNKVLELILDGAVEKMLEEMEQRNDGRTD